MLKFILPLVLGVVGIGAGVGAGILLKPAASDAPSVAAEVSEPAVQNCPPPGDGAASHAQVIDAAALVDKEFVKLNNQFVVPIITDTRVAALVVMSVTMEVTVGNTELVYSREPKLRALFLQTLFDQASLGRFSGDFATAANLRPLRDEMRVVAQRVLGEVVSDVLITDMARQDA